MYGIEVKEAAQQMRRDGVQVKVMARRLGVSTGWASKATTGIGELRTDSSLLRAGEDDLANDQQNHGAGRLRRYLALTRRRRESLQRRMEQLEVVLDRAGGGQIPHWSNGTYRVLDRVQQMFAKDQEHEMFGLMAQAWPEMVSHLVQWKKVRKQQDKSEEGFRAVASRVHDYVIREHRPPSVADDDAQVQEDARWLWRWKSNANCRTGRKRNAERAQLFTEIGIIVEMLRSPVPSVHGAGAEMLKTGRWTSLFRALMMTDGS